MWGHPGIPIRPDSSVLGDTLDSAAPPEVKTLRSLQNRLVHAGWQACPPRQKRGAAHLAEPIELRMRAEARQGAAAPRVVPAPEAAAVVAAEGASAPGVVPASEAVAVVAASGGLRHLPSMDIESEDLELYVPPRPSGLPGLTMLDRWQSHRNYAAGMRHAELATFWTVNGIPLQLFPKFLTWVPPQAIGPIVARSPSLPCEGCPELLSPCGFLEAHGHGDKFGDTNTSAHWPQDFAPSLTAALEQGIAASLHGLVPALGLPSDLTRIIDGISAKSGEALRGPQAPPAPCPVSRPARIAVNAS